MFRSRSISLIVVFLSLIVVPLQAQQSTPIITVALTENLVVGLRPLLEQYDQTNPEIQIEIVTPGYPALTTAENIEDRLDELQDYVRRADLHIAISLVDPLTTRAGYFLNLDSLTSADPTFNADDFYNGMLTPYQWDGGTWALPIASDLQVMYYNPSAFDEAGLPYPDASWTAEDLREIAQDLTSVGEDGTAEVAPINSLFSVPFLSMLSLSEPLYDSSQVQLYPTINEVDLEMMFERWMSLETDGLMSRSQDYQKPIIIGVGSMMDTMLRSGYQVAPIPGIQQSFSPIAVAINSGTNYPEEAYQIARYLTDDVEVFNAIGSPIPARKSLATLADDNAYTDLFTLADTAEPYTNFLFFWYLFTAYPDVINNNIPVDTILTNAQLSAVGDLEAASKRVGADLTVELPINTITDASDVRFGVVGITSLPVDTAIWQRVANDFASTYPDSPSVTIVPIDNPYQKPVSQAQIVEQSDCFYTPAIMNTNESLTNLLALDPLLSAEPDLDMSDFPPGTLGKLRLDGSLYGFPMEIQPQVIVYNIDQLEALGVAPPEHGWTVNDFELLLRSVNDNGDGIVAMDTRSVADTYLLNLIASYGAVPIDFSTNPPTIDFTSERSINAIRQVLDLQKNGYVLFNPTTLHYDPSVTPISSETPLHIQFYSPIHNQRATYILRAIDTTAGNYGMVLFPEGLESRAIDYDLGAGYISADTPFIDACLQFIQYASLRPDLFIGVPARTSVMDNQLTHQIYDEDTISFFNSVHDLMRQPNIVEFPFAGTQEAVVYAEGFVSVWLLRVITRYLLDDADLETELIEAEQYTREYLACIATIPAFDPVNQNIDDFVELHRDCFRAVDPTI